MCDEHPGAVEEISERNWFFRLSRYRDELLALVESGRLRIEPARRRNEVLAVFLALFIYFACHRQWLLLETGGEEGLFGYDFSQGYTSLERDPVQAAPPVRRVSWWRRWLQERAAKKQQLDRAFDYIICLEANKQESRPCSAPPALAGAGAG